MNQANNQLNKYHVTFLIHKSMVGTNIMALPLMMSQAGYNEWYLIFIIGIIAQLSLWGMIRLAAHFPEEDLYQIHTHLLGAWFGKLANIFYLSWIVLIISQVCSGYLKMLQKVSDQEVSHFPTILIFLVTFYLSSKGIKVIAHYCIVIFFIGLSFHFLTVWGLIEGTWTHIFPFFQATWPDIINALFKTIPAIVGFELISFYYLHISNKKDALRHASAGLWISILTYSFILISSVFYFSPWQLKHITFPFLNIINQIETVVIAGLSSIIASVWILLVIAVMATYFWASRRGLHHVLKSQRPIYHWLLLLFIYGTTYFTDQFYDRLPLKDIISYIAYATIFWPCVLLLIYHIKRRIRQRLAG